jgi:hypothetical protein
MSARGPNSIAEFGLYLQVDEHKRNNLANEVESLDLNDYAGVAHASRALLVTLLRGDLPIGVAQEARGLLTMQLSALASQAKKESGGYGPGTQVLVNVLQETRKAKPLQATYTVRETPALTEGDEPLDLDAVAEEATGKGALIDILAG